MGESTCTWNNGRRSAVVCIRTRALPYLGTHMKYAYGDNSLQSISVVTERSRTTTGTMCHPTCDARQWLSDSLTAKTFWAGWKPVTAPLLKQQKPPAPLDGSRRGRYGPLLTKKKKKTAMRRLWEVVPSVLFCSLAFADDAALHHGFPPSGSLWNHGCFTTHGMWED
ncbi:hypothetical protein LX36DRAFT_382168 [Colletotrichum falcatum]|nr:hypothetical protein LX36DRAFT_382168 [Colletotrichum falcatum]